MKAKATAWRVLRDPAPLRFPDSRDLLATVVAESREAARETAHRLFPAQPVVVVLAAHWPLTEGCAGGRP